MIPASETLSALSRALGKCCREAMPVGRWHWQCTVLNGARLSVAASLREGFLSLEASTETSAETSLMLERAIFANATLHNGAKLVLDATSHNLYLHSDIAVLDEPQVLTRLQWAIDGFHDGIRALTSLDADCVSSPGPAEAAAAKQLDHLRGFLRDCSWHLSKRGPDEFAVELESEFAPLALVHIDESGITASVELVRCNHSDGAVPEALAVYLLTVTRETRLVRATKHCGGKGVFALQARLPA